MLETINRIIVMALPVLFAVGIHEAAHGFAAWKMGDDTASRAGRITLNPLRHIDIFGSILLPLVLVLSRAPFVFGYAKPVPINPAYFRDYRRGMILTALAGPFANFSLMLLGMFVVLMFYQAGTPLQSTWVGVFGLFILINFVLMLFNLIPIPPLDGSRVISMFMSWRTMAAFNSLERFGILILLFLVIFDSRLHVLSSVFMGAFWLLSSFGSFAFGATFADYFMSAAFNMLR